MNTYLLNRVENIVSKEEIACFEQFLRLSQSFQKSSAAEASESVYMWERVNILAEPVNVHGHILCTILFIDSCNQIHHVQIQCFG